MSVKVTYKDDDVINRLRKVVKSEQEVYDQLFVTALRIETLAKQLVPVITGRLKTSIHTATDKSGSNTYTAGGKTFDGTFSRKAQLGEVLVGTNVEYAINVYMNQNSQGYKFMDKALEGGFGELEKLIADKLIR